MKHFIYVFDEENKNKLIELGFTQIKNDCLNSIYIFALPLNDKFSLNILDGVSNYSLSNTLTF